MLPLEMLYQVRSAHRLVWDYWFLYLLLNTVSVWLLTVPLKSLAGKIL